MTDIILAGVGGQGTVLASKLLARAAMDGGLPVRTAETIGMAQRGGCVVTHVRIGSDNGRAGSHVSSMIPFGRADMIIGFEPGEAVRCLPYLKKDGRVVTVKNGVIPVTASLGGCRYSPEKAVDYLKSRVSGLVLLDSEDIAEKCGSYKVINVALLGAAARSGLGEITARSLEKAVKETVPERFLEMNLRALALQ